MDDVGMRESLVVVLLGLSTYIPSPPLPQQHAAAYKCSLGCCDKADIASLQGPGRIATVH
jgi:hypothetical protein